MNGTIGNSIYNATYNASLTMILNIATRDSQEIYHKTHDTTLETIRTYYSTTRDATYHAICNVIQELV